MPGDAGIPLLIEAGVPGAGTPPSYPLSCLERGEGGRREGMPGDAGIPLLIEAGMRAGGSPLSPSGIDSYK